MSESGYFKVDRSVFGHDLFEGEPYSRRDAWLWLLSKAAWRPYTLKGGRVRVALDRGQLCHSIRHMGDTWGWGRNKVDKFLSELVKHGAIAVAVGDKAGTQQSVITICNYDAYQVDTLETGDSQGTVGGQSGDNREDIQPIQNTSSSLPADLPGNPDPVLFDPDWELDEIWINAALTTGIRRDRIPSEWRYFRDYQLVHGQHLPGVNHGSHDWLATWRRWCDNPLRLVKEAARMRDAPKSGGNGLTGQAARLQELQDLAMEEEGLTDEFHAKPAGAPSGDPVAGRDTAALDRGGPDRDKTVGWVSGDGREPSAALLRVGFRGAYRGRESSNLRRQKPHG